MYVYGKKKVWRAVMATGDAISQLQNIGYSYSTGSAFDVSSTFVSSLYYPALKYNESHGDSDKLQVELIGKDTPLQRIPPSEAGFKRHVKRSCYQTIIWMHSHHAKPDFGIPDKNG